MYPDSKVIPNNLMAMFNVRQIMFFIVCRNIEFMSCVLNFFLELLSFFQDFFERVSTFLIPGTASAARFGSLARRIHNF